MSISVRWDGRSAPPELVGDLKRRGITVGLEGTVIRFASAVPDHTESIGDWIWVSARAIGDDEARLAATRGAYDSISLKAEDAPARLARRIEELACVDVDHPRSTPGLIGSSTATRQLIDQLWRAARTSMPVLLTGETGTGKEVAARLIHSWSARREKRLVAINCAGIPNELIEAELFGYVRGAFSGAVARYEGQIAAAEGGTVFLDEIDDTPPTLQIKLLRLLEDRVVSRLGENAWHKVDFRLIAATNRDLRAMIARGQFGQDLYERLAIVEVRVPPLRERDGDIPALVTHLIERFYKEEAGTPVRVRAVSSEALRALAAYPFPGNVRELRNIVFEALIQKRRGDELLLADLPRRVLTRGTVTTAGTTEGTLVNHAALAARMDARALNLRDALDDLARRALELALDRTHGNASEAAKLLGEVGRGNARDPGGTVRAMMRRLRVHARRPTS